MPDPTGFSWGGDGDVFHHLFKSHVFATGWVLVQNVPDEPYNSSLLRLATALGTVRTHYGLSKENEATANGGDAVFIIGDRPETPDSTTPISQTCGSFACHTDEYFLEFPASFVLLLCCNPDPDGGGCSLVVHIDDIVRHLSRTSLRTLQQPLFPSHQGMKPVLRNTGDDWRISYNRHQISQQWKRWELTPSPQAIATLDELDHLMNENCIRVEMDAGDCLVVDNQRALHGREAFTRSSIRRLKRVRVR